MLCITQKLCILTCISSLPPSSILQPPSLSLLLHPTIAVHCRHCIQALHSNNRCIVFSFNRIPLAVSDVNSIFNPSISYDASIPFLPPILCQYRLLTYSKKSLVFPHLSFFLFGLKAPATHEEILNSLRSSSIFIVGIIFKTYGNANINLLYRMPGTLKLPQKKR